MKTHAPIEDAKFKEARYRYLMGRLVLKGDYIPRCRVRDRSIPNNRAIVRQPKGYYNQTRDVAHLHPRHLRP